LVKEEKENGFCFLKGERTARRGVGKGEKPKRPHAKLTFPLAPTRGEKKRGFQSTDEILFSLGRRGKKKRQNEKARDGGNLFI